MATVKTIKVYTKEHILSQRLELMKKAIELLKGQARSNARYAKRLQIVAYNIAKLDKLLGD